MSPIEVREDSESLLEAIKEIDLIFQDNSKVKEEDNQKWLEYKGWYLKQRELYLNGNLTNMIFYAQVRSLKKFFSWEIGLPHEILFKFENDDILPKTDVKENEEVKKADTSEERKLKGNYCPFCGNEILIIESKFCNNCGEALGYSKPVRRTPISDQYPPPQYKTSQHEFREDIFCLLCCCAGILPAIIYYLLTDK